MFLTIIVVLISQGSIIFTIIAANIPIDSDPTQVFTFELAGAAKILIHYDMKIATSNLEYDMLKLGNWLYADRIKAKKCANVISTLRKATQTTNLNIYN